MGDRLSDEHLAAIYSLDHWKHRDRSVASIEEVRSMIDEIRERRAQDLSAFEEIVLQSHLTRIADDPLVDRAVVRLLDKLLTRGNR